MEDTEKITAENAPSHTPVLEPSLLLAPPPPAERIPTLPQLAIALGGLSLIFVFSYLPTLFDRQNAREAEAEDAARAEAPTEAAHSFGNVHIAAEAAYVWDVKNQRALYNKNASARLPLASLTKLMTALVAYETLGPDARIPITKGAVRAEGDSNLSPGETFSLSELAGLTLAASSNAGAYALAAAAGAALASPTGVASAAFVREMNAKAEELGLLHTSFENPTGLDLSEVESGSSGSARDIVFLMEYLILQRPGLVERTRVAASVVHSQNGAAINALNTNELAQRIPGILGSKTGLTDLAGGNLVVAYDAGLNRPIIIAVLGSTRHGRFSDISALIAETARALREE